MNETSDPKLTCIGCGDELPDERAELGYRYCTKQSCQNSYHRGLTITAIGQNKSADILVVSDPDEIRRRGEAGELASKDTRIGLDYRPPAPGTKPARDQHQQRQHAQAPRPWTAQQEKIVRLYHEMGLNPRQIVERARQNAPRLHLTEALVTKIMSSVPLRRG